ncbi:MAG TPA: ABC transporter substrate-binding protein [Beutenbergiaceae bacterium]|nr:ABC transporter substrate-binding protein [Beutenbergiaceae bacterium]
MKIRHLPALGAAALMLAACSASDPLDPETEDAGGEETQEAGSVTVGSQDYYSNEIIAEIYAQALEHAGFDVERQFSIGQRDAYMPSIEAGDISIFPEYTGNLLQFYDPDTEARTEEDVYEELQQALPDNLAVLDQAEASDQDSVTVTKEFADEHDLSSIGDLAELDEELTLGGPPELAERPYGPEGLESVYGVEVEFNATGETTVEELEAGTVDLANVFTADPRIQTLQLVPLADPEGLFLASHVVPLVTAEMADDLAPVINPVSEALSADALVGMNVQSQSDQKSPEDIAGLWLEDNGFLD